MKDAVYASVDMDRVRRQVEDRRRVVVQRLQVGESAPVTFGDTVTCFTAIGRGKLEWAVEKDGLVGKINPLTEGDETLTSRESRRSVGRADEVCR